MPNVNEGTDTNLKVIYPVRKSSSHGVKDSINTGTNEAWIRLEAGRCIAFHHNEL
ncbi:MAG: hypothetical protein HY578_07690 [Nitrospinae bacterium]|nr:hypothetical protein [Nitrospinota bacterium]